MSAMIPSLPYTVIQTHDRGKCVIATRDIEAGELVLEDSPLLVTPLIKSKAQCLQCARRVDGSFKCARCNFPMCDAKCADGNMHAMECEILTEADFEAEVEEFNLVDDHYAAILPLRCISLARRDPESWRVFQNFLSHCDQRREHNREMWNYQQEHCVEFVRDICELQETYSEAEIQRMIGIMSVNSLGIDLGPEYGELMGFYPLFSNLNHSCLANSRPVKKPSLSVEVRATRRILRGEEVTFRYIVETQPTRSRRDLIHRKWFFMCECVRCQDPTESGAYLGALKCLDKECAGSALPISPCDARSGYRCDSCEANLSEEIVSTRFRDAEIEASKKVPREGAIKHMESFLEKYEPVFHSTNYIMLNVKMKLGCIYGNVPPKSVLSKMTPEEITRKINLCQDCLHVLDILDPGTFSESTWKSRLKREISKCKFILQQMEK